MPYYAAITGAILPCMADKEDKIAAVLHHIPAVAQPLLRLEPVLTLVCCCVVWQVAREANEEQKGHIGPSSVAEGFDIAEMLVEIRK